MQSILSARFSPTHPHILASASGDRTVRVWNIFGGDLKVETTDDPHSRSRNYPMGDADEGDACIFILVGEGAGGHEWEIVTLAFHPTQRAIVTGGMDYGVRIWALPEYPIVIDPSIKKTEVGYRPRKIYFPVFATNRLHEDAIDCIEWLTDDILVSQTRNIVLVWQWLGFHRYFGGQIEGDPKPQRTDFNNSRECRRATLDGRYLLLNRGIYRRLFPDAGALSITGKFLVSSVRLSPGLGRARRGLGKTWTYDRTPLGRHQRGHAGGLGLQSDAHAVPRRQQARAPSFLRPKRSWLANRY